MPGALLVHCSTHVLDALHERTNGRTNADSLLTREIALCSVTRASKCLVHMEDDVRHCRGCAADRLAGESA